MTGFMTSVQPPAIDIGAIIDAQPVSRFQTGIMILVAMAVVMDGFDVQSMGFVAPALARDWHISSASLGNVFASSLIGMVIGAAILGAVADRRGRRPVLIASTCFVGICMVSSTFSSNLMELMALRFATGLGLGGIMGNAVALVSEYSPLRKRASLMMWVSCGFTAGAAFGGFVASMLIPVAGWRSVFIFGGVIPLAVSIMMLFWLPESMHFLALRRSGHERIGGYLRRIMPALQIGPDTRYVVHEINQKNGTMRELFAHGRGRTTVLLWGINFLNLLNLFFLANWLPTLATSAGYPYGQAAIIGVILQMGGVAGTVLMGPMIDRWGFFRVLIPINVIAAVMIFITGHIIAASLLVTLAVVAIAGFGVMGGQPANNALGSVFYPPPLRATGVGWCLGIGRIGSIAGPVVAAHLIELRWTPPQLFHAAAVPAILSAILLYGISRDERFSVKSDKPEIQSWK